jgi:hypothetical protein
VQDEFVGDVDEAHGRFEIWERRYNAIHAIGRMRPRHRGTRIEMRFVLAGRTRAVLPVFALVYVGAAYGFSTRGEAVASGVLVWVGGAVLLAAVFGVGAVRQRAALRDFVERLFSDVADEADMQTAPRSGRA